MIGKAFEKFGVEKFGEKGEDFDPTKHDAILHKPDADAEKETVVPQRILVLGASGYIGQHLVRTLSQQGHQILAAARHVEGFAVDAVGVMEIKALS